MFGGGHGYAYRCVVCMYVWYVCVLCISMYMCAFVCLCVIYEYGVYVMCNVYVVYSVFCVCSYTCSGQMAARSSQDLIHLFHTSWKSWGRGRCFVFMKVRV